VKLIRFGSPGEEKPGLQLDSGKKIDASGFGSDYDEAFFAGDGLERLKSWAEQNAETAPVVGDEVRLGPPVCRPSKIVCIGLNFSDHAAESGMEPPSEPVVFFKATTALCGPNDPVRIPRGSQKTDWEVELAVVIGKKASYVDAESAMDHVAGYALHNDYSERAFQLEQGGQWVKGKSCDTFAPLGPFMATADEIDDVNNLNMWLNVNGKQVQTGNTRKFIFDIQTVISYLSQYMTLLPGDLISTGTPPGVGLGFDPPFYLQVGDEVELGIDGLGSSTQTAIEWNA